MASTSPGTTVEQLLKRSTKENPLSLIDIKALIRWSTGLSPTQLITLAHKPVDSAMLEQFNEGLKRRLHGEPLAHITNEKEFYSRPFYINSSVLIPRPETEELVEQALLFIAKKAHKKLPLNILDIGCGSGVIGITIALELPSAQVTALDISPEALTIAQKNAQTLRAKNIEFIESDLFSGIRRTAQPSRFDLIVSNPPYIAKNDSHLEQKELQFEPQIALTDFADGLNVYRRLATESQSWLKPDGALLVEHGFNQQRQIVDLLQQANFCRITPLTDLSHNPRMILAHNLSGQSS